MPNPFSSISDQIIARRKPAGAAPSITPTGAPTPTGPPPTGFQNLAEQFGGGFKSAISLGFADTAPRRNPTDTLAEYLAAGAGSLLGSLPYFIPATLPFGAAAKGLGLVKGGTAALKAAQAAGKTAPAFTAAGRALQLGGAMATLGAVEKGTPAERAKRALTGAVTGAAFGPALGITRALPRIAATGAIGAAAPAAMGADPTEIAASGLLGAGLGIFGGEKPAPRRAPEVKPVRPFPESPAEARRITLGESILGRLGTEINVTPFRGKPVKKVVETKSYYESTRARGFEKAIKGQADSRRLKATFDRSAGVWEGSVEPSYTIKVNGSRADVFSYAARLARGQRRNLGDAQDAAVLFKPGKGTSVKYVFDNVNPDTAIKLMKKHDISGGTAKGRSLTIIDFDGSLKRSIMKLRKDLKSKPSKTNGEGKLIFKEEYQGYIEKGKVGDILDADVSAKDFKTVRTKAGEWKATDPTTGTTGVGKTKPAAVKVARLNVKTADPVSLALRTEQAKTLIKSDKEFKSLSTEYKKVSERIAKLEKAEAVGVVPKEVVTEPQGARKKLTVEQLEDVGLDYATAPFDQTNFDLNAHPRVPVAGTNYISPKGNKFTIINESIPRGDMVDFLQKFRATLIKEKADIKQLGRRLSDKQLEKYTPRSWSQQLLFEARAKQRSIESPQLDKIMNRTKEADPKIWDAITDSVWYSPEETFGRIGGSYGYETGMLLREQFHAKASMQAELLKIFNIEGKDLNTMFKNKSSEAAINELIFRELAPKDSYYKPIGKQAEVLKGVETTPEMEAIAGRIKESTRALSSKLDQINRSGQVVVESKDGDMLYMTRKDHGFPLRYDVEWMRTNKAGVAEAQAAQWRSSGVKPGSVHSEYRGLSHEAAAKLHVEAWLADYKDPQSFLANGAFTRKGRLPRSRKSIEFQRSATIMPGFERNIVKLMSDSILQVPERTSQIEFFGGNNEIVLSTSGKVPKRTWELTQRLFDTITGKAARLTKGEQKFLDGWHTYNALTRLHHSFLVQPSAFIAAFAGGRMTFSDFLVGAKKTLTRDKLTIKEVERLYDGTGILQAAARGEDFPGALTSGPRPGASAFEKVFNWMQAPGLRKTDFWARKATAVGGERVIRRAVDRILQGESKDNNTQAIIELARLRPEEIMRNKGLTTTQMKKALFNYVNNTNIVSEVPFMPPLATSSLLGRIAYTLKTFAIGFTKFASHYLIRPALKGDVMPLFKFMMLAGLYGVPVQVLRDLIKNRPTEGGLRLYFDGLSNIGGFGLASDVVRSTIDGFDLGPSIVGPMVSDLTDMGRSAAEIGQGQLVGTGRRLLRKIPVVGPGIQAGVLPSQFQSRAAEESGSFSLFPR